ncbi:photoreceptor-specific nuclear receptor [Trichonephila clavipes]|nr:photoreceptor-specific nuclear receptor [Trichonephila clavipes]
MGTRLLDLKNEKGRNKFSDRKRLSGRNRLTDILISKFQRYYAVQHERASRSQPRRRSKLVSSSSDSSQCYGSSNHLRPSTQHPAVLGMGAFCTTLTSEVGDMRRLNPSNSPVISHVSPGLTLGGPMSFRRSDNDVPPEAIKPLCDLKTSSPSQVKKTCSEECVSSDPDSRNSSSPTQPRTSPTSTVHLPPTSQVFRTNLPPPPDGLSRSAYVTIEHPRCGVIGPTGPLPPAFLGPFPPNPLDTVYEAAAKLLFFSIRWMRGIPSFLQLGFRDQAILLEEAWCDVFVLSAAQWGFPLQEGFLSFAGMIAPEKRPLVASQLHQMKNVMSQLVGQQVDHTEFSCLKALVLFRPDNLVAYDQARRRFVEWAQNEIAVVLDFHKRILFSDEAHFWLNGYVNKQNCRIWSEANPQVYVETPLHPEKLTVWCALWAGGILLQKRCRPQRYSQW